MVLKTTVNDSRTSSPCHDEFHGPRTDYVRQNTGGVIDKCVQMLDKNYGALGPDGPGVYFVCYARIGLGRPWRLLRLANEKGRGACCEPAPGV
ncbi:hypothetical protein TNCV_2728691 [Trichonephila clavipes]|nr:hypothetical protein TNCV_2728691 [Trichonephila clavipes]